MATDLAVKFREVLKQAEIRLRAISKEDGGQPHREGGWLRKELLGHLLDSSTNNHLRFTIAAAEGSYTGPQYDQESWVRLNGYRSAEWSWLVDAWSMANGRLALLVEHIPEEALSAPCIIGGAAPVTLGFVIEDYLRHLMHHIDAF